MEGLNATLPTLPPFNATEDCQKEPAIGENGLTCLAIIQRYFYNSSSMTARSSSLEGVGAT
ncbi:hypothetical protein F7725_015435 [Dissostichus mawsoni]|uniref:Uncharacterized protein n=1 Tax=Dissostichus mawsoni TaxID=36200 RepID=A0A7J5YKX0_DISMA|nr:hypothetical protein F7725_015435 [Dissostichus mawsoni]